MSVLRDVTEGVASRGWWRAPKSRWVVALAVVVVLATLVTLISRSPEPEAPPQEAPDVPSEEERPSAPESDSGGEPQLQPEQEEAEPTIDGTRLLFTHDDIARFRRAMSGNGPFFSEGDAGHGGPYSPADGERSLELAEAFLDDPSASYWRQTNLPYSSSDPAPLSMDYARPLHAGWVQMTQPHHPDRDELALALKELLLAHATDPSLDFSDSKIYPVDYPGWSPNPIFEQAQWISRLFKARDMLGREAFTDAENATFDQWMYGYANWTASWMHEEVLGPYLPGRLDRDYTVVVRDENANRTSFDGGPLIGAMAMTYHNRNAMSAAAMSLAANYLDHFDFTASTISEPEYGHLPVEDLLEHSRLFVEETIRFSVYPQGLQGDFERGDGRYHSAGPQQGWLYSINVLSLLVEMADYHAKRGDMSLWDYGTTEGYDGSAGRPVAGGFDQKNLHYFAWAMSRYVNDGWGRTNDGEPIVSPGFFHDAIPAAIVHRYAPEDSLLEAAWKREGQGFPEYGDDPQSQGPWEAHFGEGAKHIGLIEHAPYR